MQIDSTEALQAIGELYLRARQANQQLLDLSSRVRHLEAENARLQDSITPSLDEDAP